MLVPFQGLQWIRDITSSGYTLSEFIEDIGDMVRKWRTHIGQQVDAQGQPVKFEPNDFEARYRQWVENIDKRKCSGWPLFRSGKSFVAELKNLKLLEGYCGFLNHNMDFLNEDIKNKNDQIMYASHQVQIVLTENFGAWLPPNIFKHILCVCLQFAIPTYQTSSVTELKTAPGWRGSTRKTKWLIKNSTATAQARQFL